MADPAKYAVNPSTGDVVQFNGTAWSPVDKARVAKNATGDVSVFDGQAWMPLSAPQPQAGGELPGMLAKGVNDLHANGISTAALTTNAVSDDAKRQIGLTARAGGTGLMSIPNAVGDAANQTINFGVQGVNALAGTNIPQMGLPSQATQQLMTQAGIPEAKTPLEKGVQVAGSMLASGPSAVGTAKGLAAGGIKGLEPIIEQGWSGLQGLFKSGAPKAGAAEAPSTQAIKDASQAAYKASEDAGVIIKPNVLQDFSANVNAKLADLSYRPALQPKIGILLDEIASDTSRGNITLKGVDGLRQVALGISRDGNASERMMARKIVSYLDDSLSNLAPSDVIVTGTADPAEAVGALTKARMLWRTQAKSQVVDDLLEAATNKASRTNSGGNLQNAVRQGFSKILDQPKLRRMFDPDEITAIQQLVDGSRTQNTLRTIGRLAPSSNSMLGPILAQMGLTGGGYAAGGIPGAAAGLAVPAVGAAAKALATRSTLNEANAVSRLVRSAAAPAAQAAEPFNPQALYAQILGGGTNALKSPYAQALLRQLSGGSVPAIAGPGTAPQGQP